MTLFDTAELYGFGRSERILGQALGEDRERVFLATKLFPLLPVAPVVEQRAVASANRLDVRRIDLYQVHQPNPVVRDGTIMRGMRALQRVGLVGEVGVSNYSLDRWQAAEIGAGQPGAEQPGRLQPGQPVAGTGPAAVRRVDRPHGDRLQPARAGAPVGPV